MSIAEPMMVQPGPRRCGYLPSPWRPWSPQLVVRSQPLTQSAPTTQKTLERRERRGFAEAIEVNSGPPRSSAFSAFKVFYGVMEFTESDRSASDQLSERIHSGRTGSHALVVLEVHVRLRPRLLLHPRRPIQPAPSHRSRAGAAARTPTTRSRSAASQSHPGR